MEGGESSGNMGVGSLANLSTGAEEPLGFDTYVGGEFFLATKQTKFDLYCGESTVDRHQELDMIDYYKANSLIFLILSMITRDVLAILLTTVVYESAFSVGSSVIDKWRSALSHESVEALIGTQDWLYEKC